MSDSHNDEPNFDLSAAVFDFRSIRLQAHWAWGRALRSPGQQTGLPIWDALNPEDFGIIDGGGGHLAIDREPTAKKP